MKQSIKRWGRRFRRHYTRQEQELAGDFRAVERLTRRKGRRCTNCDAMLTGPFCHICGQRDDDIKRPIWTFMADMLDNILQADSKILRSLYLLLLLPGGLTRSYMQGMRARFSPPLRLYLLVSVAFFLILSIANVLIVDIKIERKEGTTAPMPPIAGPQEAGKGADDGPTDTDTAPSDTGQQQETVAGTGPVAGTMPEMAAGQVDGSTPVIPAPQVPTKADGEKIRADAREQARAKLRALLNNPDIPLPPDARAEIESALAEDDEEAIEKLNGRLAKVLSRIGSTGAGKIISGVVAANGDDEDNIAVDVPGFPYDVDVQMFVKDTGGERVGLSQEELDRFIDEDEDDEGSEYMRGVLRGFSIALKYPQEFNELFNKWLPRVLFVLMPVFALILRIFHWGKDRYYLNQLVFSLHFHTFLFLLLIGLVIIVPYFGGQTGVLTFWIASSAYLIVALKVGQDQSWLRAFIKAGFIWVSYMMMMVSALAYGVLEGLRELH